MASDRPTRVVTRLSRRWALVARLLAALAVPLGVAGSATADTASEAEQALRLATTLYYEGVPYDEAAAITPAGAARLAELLGDPAERKHHAQALLILGMAAHPGAYEALTSFALRVPRGELDTADFRACRALPLAMGHLARNDDRALAWLTARARDASDPGFTRGAMRGQRLGHMLRDVAIMGLGMAGRPEAETLLHELQERGAASQAERGASAEALELSRRIRARGRAAALSGRLR